MWFIPQEFTQNLGCASYWIRQPLHADAAHKKICSVMERGHPTCLWPPNIFWILFSIFGEISRSWVSTLNFKASLKLGCRSQNLGPANQIHWASLLAQSVKNLPAMQESACNAGGPGSIPGSGTSPGEGNGNPLQYSYLENAMGRGACIWLFATPWLQSMELQRVKYDWEHTHTS